MVLRRLALLGWLGASGLAAASPEDHAAQIAARYESMLAANPTEAIALDRLWKNAQERGQTEALLERHRLGDALVYGGLLKLAGRPQEAAAAYQLAAQRDPASPLPPLALAELAQPEDAAGLYETALGKLPAGDRREADILLKLGSARLAAGHPKEAAESWERLVARNPDDPALRRRLIETYEAHGLAERAIPHLDYLQAHAEPADRALALRDLARLHEARGEFDPAREALENGLALTARDNWLHAEMETSLIRLYERAGRAPELQAHWEAEAGKSPKDLDVYRRLENLAREQGDPPAQRRWLEKIVSLAPGNRDDARELARLLGDAGERVRAAALYDGLLKARPRDLELLLARAELDVQMGREQAAADRLEAAARDEATGAAALEFFLRHHLDAAAERRLRADVLAKPAAEEPPVALARFLFSHRRPADARAALETMIAAAPDRTARLSRAAECYRQADQMDDALRCWREWVKLAPESTAPQLAIADALAAKGDPAGAADSLQRAFDLTPPGPAQVEVDRRLFGTLNTAAQEPGRGLALFGARPRRGRPATPALTQQIARLDQAARDRPEPENFLRLARWQSWMHAGREAAAAAERAAALDPASIPAHELLVSLAAENGDRAESARRIREMLTIDPSHKARWLKALADLQIEDGDLDRALGLYQELASANPGSLDALTDLALAQQRAERWYDAKTTWERAYALPATTPPQRAEIRRPLLAAMERLGEFPRARDILQAAVDAAPTLAEKRDAFRQLADFCARHGFTAALAAHYAEQLAAQPQDFFTLTALAELRRAQGQGKEAYALLGRALYSSPDPAETLGALVDAAETLGDEDAAIAHQRHLVTMSRGDKSEAAEKLASLESANLDDDAAVKTWEGIVARFPRDAGVLGRAADFFETVGGARAILHRLAAFDASDLKRMYRLGQLDAAAGDLPGARKSFELVLAGAEPEKPEAPPQTPADSTAPSKLDRHPVRLAAIREIARALPDAGRPAWIARWQKAAAAGARNEPLWAFYYAGAKPETAALLARWVQEQPGNEAVEELFIRLSLRLGDAALVTRWTWGDDPAKADADRADRMLTGLAQFLIDGGEPAPGLLDTLFPAGCSREVRWKAAEIAFAGRQRYAEAVALGTRVFEESSVNRANYAIEVAGWNLLLGRTDDARAILRRAIDGPGADSLGAGGDQYFSAVYEYWHLLPEAERASFAEGLLRRNVASGGPAQAALTRVLLHALMGDRPETNAALDEVISLRMLSAEGASGSVDARRLTYLLANGGQLVTWGLDAAVTHLWRRTLAETSPFQWQDPECQNVLGEIRAQLAFDETVHAPGPSQASELLDDFLRTKPDPNLAHTMASGLSALAQPSLAARVHEYLVRVEPTDPEHRRELLEAYAAASDTVATQRTLQRLLDESPGLPPADLTTRLATELDRDGDPESARRLLARQLQANPRAIPIGLALARRECAAGRLDEAAAVLHCVLPSDSGLSCRLALASLEAARGNHAEEKRLLQECASRSGDPSHVDAGARLIVACLAEGDRAGAVEAARDPAAALAGAIAVGKNQDAARELFKIALRRATDPAMRFAAGSGLLTFADGAGFPREIGRLRRLAGDDPPLLAQWEDARYEQARSRGLDAWLENELKTDWAAGRGSPAAGAHLVNLYVATNQTGPLTETVKTLTNTDSPWEPTAFAAQAALVDGGHADLAIPLIERLSRRLPQSEPYALAWVRALWKNGQLSRVDALAEELKAAAPVRANIGEHLARQFLDLGDKPRAVAWYRRAGAKVSAGGRLTLAQLELEGGDLASARGDLREAYRISETADLGPLVDWLQAAGQLEDERRAPGGDFPLTLRRRGEAAVLIFDRLVRASKTPAARRMAMAHPELLAAAPELASRLCASSTPEEHPAILAVLEQAITQVMPPPPRLERELAEVCIQRAADVPSEARALLTRAHELRPQDFRIAQKLAERFLADRQPAKAAAALQAFTDKDALVSDRQAAEALLAHD